MERVRKRYRHDVGCCCFLLCMSFTVKSMACILAKQGKYLIVLQRSSKPKNSKEQWLECSLVALRKARDVHGSHLLSTTLPYFMEDKGLQLPTNCRCDDSFFFARRTYLVTIVPSHKTFDFNHLLEYSHFASSVLLHRHMKRPTLFGVLTARRVL